MAVTVPDRFVHLPGGENGGVGGDSIFALFEPILADDIETTIENLNLLRAEYNLGVLLNKNYFWPERYKVQNSGTAARDFYFHHDFDASNWTQIYQTTAHIHPNRDTLDVYLHYRGSVRVQIRDSTDTSTIIDSNWSSGGGVVEVIQTMTASGLKDQDVIIKVYGKDDSGALLLYSIRIAESFADSSDLP